MTKRTQETHEMPEGPHDGLSGGSGALVSGAREQVVNPWRRGPIVVALHGGESSSATLAIARQLAQRQALPLHVVTVVEYEVLHLGRLSFGALPEWVVRDLGGPRREEMTRRLRDVLAGDEGWTLEVRYGSPPHEIADAARALDATLVIVDAAPRRRARRAVAGIRALQIVRHAPCPVLSVGPDRDRLPRRIVASVDFSPASIRAVQTAMMLAGEAETLSLAHVPFPLQLEHPIRDATGALIGGDVNEAFEELLNVVRPHAPPSLAIETKELHGKVADAILSHAEALQADLIATGTRGANVVERFFVGSVATNLVNLAECSVLASPAPPADAEVATP